MEPPENAKAREDKIFFMYMDNFFTSLPLFRRLKERGHDVIGTIRASHIEKAPLKTIESMKKLARGTYNQLTDKNSWITLVCYHDNSIVTVASTSIGTEPVGQARYWSGALKKKISIPQPACIIYMSGIDRMDQNISSCIINMSGVDRMDQNISSCRINMSGVDRMDQNISCYRINIHSKKWYWPLIAFLLNVTMNNAWQLYRLTPKGKENDVDLLAFTRNVVQKYCIDVSWD
jgi:hypothetical protein